MAPWPGAHGFLEDLDHPVRVLGMELGEHLAVVLNAVVISGWILVQEAFHDSCDRAQLRDRDLPGRLELPVESQVLDRSLEDIILEPLESVPARMNQRTPMTRPERAPEGVAIEGIRGRTDQGVLRCRSWEEMLIADHASG